MAKPDGKQSQPMQNQLACKFKNLFLVFPQLISVEIGRHLICSSMDELIQECRNDRQFRKTQTSS